MIDISDLTLQQRSKVLEWLIEDGEIAYLCGEGLTLTPKDLWDHINKYREYWDK